MVSLGSHVEQDAGMPAVKRKSGVLHSESDSSSDLESDLLALARRNHSANNVSRKPNSDSDTSSGSDGDWNPKGKLKKKKKRFKLSPKYTKNEFHKHEKHEFSSEEEHEPIVSSEPEEGEVSDSGSAGSKEFSDGYDDNLMGDEEDQARLAAMTEKEREQELFNRSENREALRMRFEVERKLKMAKKQEQKLQDRKEERCKQDSMLRSKERRKTVEEIRKDKKGQALNALKARREEKERRAEEKEKAKQEIVLENLHENEDEGHIKKLRASDIYSDDSGDDSEKSISSSKSSNSSNNVSSSSSPHANQKCDSWKTKKMQYVSCREELNRIRLSRHRMEKHANQERVFRLEFVSNKDFQESEFQRWRNVLLEADIGMPTLAHVEAKRRQLEECQHYQFRDEDIDQIVREKCRFKQAPHNFAMKKTLLLKEKAMAEARGDHDAVARVGQQLQELEDKAEELERQRTSTLQSISYINERNRLRNIQEAERAIMEEVRANQGRKSEDPFTRRHTKPQIVHRPKDAPYENDLNLQSEGSFSVSHDLPDLPNQLPKNCKQDSKLSAFSDGRGGSDLFDAHDFDIKIDLPGSVPSPAVNSSTKISAVNRETVPRRSLNLQDYKKRRGLI